MTMNTTTIHAPRFADVYDHENTTVVGESGYHQMRQCSCSPTTNSGKGAYRDVHVRLADGSSVFFYHQTPVVVADAERNTYRLTSGGYKTATTKERLNRHTPRGVRVYQEDFEWFVEVDGDTREFVDGMTVEAPR